MSTATKVSELLRIAQRGPLRARDLDDAGIPRAYLARLVERNELEHVGRGLYRLPDAPTTELHTLAEVSARVPHATICLLSALQAHQLTTELPHAVWIMVDTRARAPKIDTPAIEVVRAQGKAREYGRESWRIDGIDVQITTPAKTVADCFRYRRHVGLDVAIAALRDYLAKGRGRATRHERKKRGGSGVGRGGYGIGKTDGSGYGDPRTFSIDTLMEAASVDRVAKVLRPYLDALA